MRATDRKCQFGGWKQVTTDHFSFSHFKKQTTFFYSKIERVKDSEVVIVPRNASFSASNASTTSLPGFSLSGLGKKLNSSISLGKRFAALGRVVWRPINDNPGLVSMTTHNLCSPCTPRYPRTNSPGSWLISIHFFNYYHLKRIRFKKPHFPLGDYFVSQFVTL